MLQLGIEKMKANAPRNNVETKFLNCMMEVFGGNWPVDAFRLIVAC